MGGLVALSAVLALTLSACHVILPLDKRQDRAARDMGPRDLNPTDGRKNPDRALRDLGGADGEGSDLRGADLHLSPTTGMAVWARASNPRAQFSIWDGASFGPPQDAFEWGQLRILAGADARTRDEAVVVGIARDGHVKGQMRNGGAWTPLPNPLSSGASSTVSETFWWGADVAYEQGGDALVVWNTNNGPGRALSYVTWNGKDWTGAMAVSAYDGAEPQQLHLASNPTRDELVLVVNDANADDHVLVWDGSGWGNHALLDDTGTDNNDQTALNVAYEQQSGRALVVYGKDEDPKVYVRLWNGVAWSEEPAVDAPVGVTAQASWLVLGSTAHSDHIALGVLTTGGTDADIWLAVWDGSAWGSVTLAEASATDSVHPNVAVAFESRSGQALAVYGEKDQSVCRYRTWDAASGWSEERSTPNIGGIPNSLTLDSDPHADQIMLSVQNESQGLRFVLWNGDSWRDTGLQETDTGEKKNQPFVFLWDR